VLIRRSSETARLLQTWLESAVIKEGAVFRRLVGRGRVGERMEVNSVAEIFKRVAGSWGWSPRMWRR
jgi:hypothetical protein